MHFRLFIGNWKPHTDRPIIFSSVPDVPGEVLTIREKQTWHTWAGEFVLSWSCVTWTYLEHKSVLGLQFDIQHALLDIYQSPCPFCAAPEDRRVIGHRLRALIGTWSCGQQRTGHDQRWRNAHRAQRSCCLTLLNNKDSDCSASHISQCVSNVPQNNLKSNRRMIDGVFIRKQLGVS